MAIKVIHGTHTLRDGGPTLSYSIHLPLTHQRQHRRAALIAHPSGRLGGCKEDHVLLAVAELLAEDGFVAVRYDSRGAGESEGSPSWTGATEASDFRELVDDLVLPYLFPQVPTASPAPTASCHDSSLTKTYDLILCGYSFGSLAASSCPPLAPPPSLPIARLRTSYLLISYPLSVLWALTFLRSGPPTTALRRLVAHGKNRVLAVHGDKDNFSGADKLRRWAEDLGHEAGAEDAWQAVEIAGADHFWRDRAKKRQMIEVIRRWVREGVETTGSEGSIVRDTS